jgi:hypothetical protein
MKGAVANRRSTSKHGFSNSRNKAAIGWLSAGLIVQLALLADTLGPCHAQVAWV